MKYVLGVDGGKSKTVCLIADETGRIAGWGRAKSSDKYDVPLEQALDEVSKSVQAALFQGGLEAQNIESGCFGLAGDDWPEDNQELSAGLVRRGLVKNVLVKNDAQIALRANTADGFGVILCAGTHLAAAIRTPDNTEWHSAWFSVQGMGGASTGNKIVWSVLNAYDGRGQPTILTDLVLAAMSLQSPSDLLRALSTGHMDDATFASLAPLVFKAHNRSGDPVAARIIVEMGQDMARWATGLMRRFDLLNLEFPVILTGGLFKSEGKLLLDALSMEIHVQAPKAVLQFAKYETVIGALAYAYEMAGFPVSNELLSTLQKNLPGVDLFRTG